MWDCLGSWGSRQRSRPLLSHVHVHCNCCATALCTPLPGCWLAHPVSSSCAGPASSPRSVAAWFHCWLIAGFACPPLLQLYWAGKPHDYRYVNDRVIEEAYRQTE